MPAKQLTPDSDIADFLQEQIDRFREQILYLFRWVGEACVSEARTGGNYRDRTGNLRSSVGYVIVDDGKVITTAGFESSEGGRQGSTFARRLVAQFPKGIVLIVVAGMNYASYVAARGYNVLDSSELQAERLIPKFMKQLGFELR